MRHGLSVVPAIVLLTACSSGPQKDWPYHQQLATVVPTCPYSLHHEPPRMAGVTAHGLEGPQYWFPGQAIKVNWVAAKTGMMDMGVREEGVSAPAFRLAREAGPSLITFPGPGCWELILTFDGRSESTWVRVLPNPPIALLADGNRVADEAQVKRLLDSLPSASPVEIDRTGQRPSYWLKLQGLHGQIDEVQYYPTYQGRRAFLVFDRSILGGDCSQVGEIARILPKEVSSHLDDALAGAAATTRQFDGKASNCEHFTQVS